MTLKKIKAYAALNESRRRTAIRFWKPEWRWFGWGTLRPIQIDHDEYARRTLVLGVPVTGRLVIALWFCRSGECLREALAHPYGYIHNESSSSCLYYSNLNSLKDSKGRCDVCSWETP